MARGYSNLEVAPPHSDLEVAYDHTSPVPVAHSHAEKIPVVGHAVSSEPFHYDPSDSARSPDTHSPPRPEAQPLASAGRRRICGLPLRTFLIILLVVLVAVAGAVGGGIAGARAAVQNKNTAAESSSLPAGDAKTTQSSTVTDGPLPTPSASTTSTITTTLLPKPVVTSEVLERDCPSSDGSVYEALQSPLYRFRKLCDNKYVGFGVVVINTNADHSLDACIDRCAKWNKDNQDKIRAGDADMCNSVCWRNSWDQDLPGQCFGFPLRNTTGGEGGGESTWRVGEGATSDTRCDSAAWMNPYSVGWQFHAALFAIISETGGHRKTARMEILDHDAPKSPSEAAPPFLSYVCAVAVSLYSYSRPNIASQEFMESWPIFLNSARIDGPCYV